MNNRSILYQQRTSILKYVDLQRSKPWPGDERQNVRAKRKSPPTVVVTGKIPAAGVDGGGVDKIGRLIVLSVEAVEEATGCPAGCIEDQVRKGHEAQGIKVKGQVRPTTAGGAESDTSVF